MTETVLVTGGAGYVGSHACKALARAGFLPVAYDNLSRGFAHAVKWGPLERGDLLDPEQLAAVFAKHRPEAVIHFAAFAYVAESVADPAAYYRNNVVGTLTLLDAMRAAGVGRLVFSSSCATYGAAEQSPVTEDTPQRPVSPYGATKLMCERLLADYRAAYSLKSIALRYFNAGGADPDGEIGEDHDPETHLIPLAIDVAAGRRARFTILGDDYDTPDGTCVRDFVHVSDLADAHVTALGALRAGEARPAYNLGGGAGVSVLEVVKAVERVVGRPVAIEIGPRRPGDPPALVADASLAARELGWRPVRSGLETMIRDAWVWRERRYSAAKASGAPAV